MKKAILVCMMLSVGVVQAQHKPFQFGFKAAANLGWFHSTEDDYVNKGVSAGVEIPLHGDTYLRTGLKFDNAFSNVLKGDNSQNPEVKNSARNNYIELNVAIIF